MGHTTMIILPTQPRNLPLKVCITNFFHNPRSIPLGWRGPLLSTMLINDALAQNNTVHIENDVLFSNDTGILGKGNSKFSQQESNLRPSDY